MLSDEEKKAVDKINKLVEYLRKWNKNFTIVPADIKYFEKILDMIKTYIRMIDENIEEILEQSKEIEEIEELKEKNKTLKNLQNDTNRLYTEMIERKNYFERELQKLEDKIKAKIEEYKKEIDKLYKKKNWYEPWDTEKKNKYMHYIEFGQSLLEKE